jgi:hypothetical protein
VKVAYPVEVNDLTNTLTSLNAEKLLELQGLINVPLGATWNGVYLLWIVYAILVLLPPCMAWV